MTQKQGQEQVQGQNLSTKQKRERAKENLERAKEAIKMIEDRIELKNKICDKVRSNWVPTEHYKENAFFEYETDEEYLDLQLQQKELEWEEQFAQLEQSKKQHEMNAKAAREAIKRHRG